MSTSEKVWSALQNEIFAFVAAFVITLTKDLVIVARAGTGKTTTIVEIANRIPKSLDVMFCAFGRDIAKELSTRLPGHCPAKTLHAIGMGMIRRRWKYVKVVEKKLTFIVDDILARTPARMIPDDFDVSDVFELTAFGKNMIARTESDLAAIADRRSIGESETRPLIVRMAWEAMARSARDTRTIDFDDMVFFPWYFNLPGGFHDIVIVDEAQDMNAAQLWIATRICKSEGRLIVVGDDRQAIYGWRGADSDGMGRMTDGATVLPLSITYRCPKAVVEIAQAIVPDYSAAPEAPEGTVTSMSPGQMIERVQAGDFVISRKNAPLMPLCLKLLAMGKPAMVKGRDVAKSLVSLIRKSKCDTLADLSLWLETYKTKEVAKLANQSDSEKRVEALQDRLDCILALMDGLSTCDELIGRIEGIFTSDAPEHKVILTSTHRAKGLERDNVYVLADTYRHGKGITEEDNLWYVAVTRSKSFLALVA